MAKKKKKRAAKKKHGKRPGPTLKAKKAYYGLIRKAHKRLTLVLKKHDPAALHGA